MHLQRQIDKLKTMILSLGGLAEKAVEQAIQSVEQRDVDRARKVIDGDREIDLMEIEVEEECLHTLALHQPVAIDMRFIIAVLKINNDLERIGDLAVNVAEQAIFLAKGPAVELGDYALNTMCGLVQQMLRDSLNALVNIDSDLAEQVRERDDRVDAIHRQMYEYVEAAVNKRGAFTGQHMHLLSVSRNLERIADHAVNIAEDVLYMDRGDILRHHRPHPLLSDAGGSRADEQGGAT